MDESHPHHVLDEENVDVPELQQPQQQPQQQQQQQQQQEFNNPFSETG